MSAGPTDGPWAQREASLERIRKVGRQEWQKESGYRQQARVENSFFRYKSVFGGGLKARHSKAQRREAAIGCHILNRMAEFGRPSSYALVGDGPVSRVRCGPVPIHAPTPIRELKLGPQLGDEKVCNCLDVIILERQIADGSLNSR